MRAERDTRAELRSSRRTTSAGRPRRRSSRRAPRRSASTWSRRARSTGGPARSGAIGPRAVVEAAAGLGDRALAPPAAAWRRARRPCDSSAGFSTADRLVARRPSGRRRTSDARRSWRPTWLPPSAPAGPERRRTTFYLSRNVLARNPRRRGHGITPASRSSPMRSHEYPSSRSTISECSPCSGARRRAGGRSSNCTGTAGSR